MIQSQIHSTMQCVRWPAFVICLGFAAASCSAHVARADGGFDASAANSASSDQVAAASPADDNLAAGSRLSRDGQSTAPAAPHGPRIEGGQVNGHWREGTRLIDQLGQFKIVGDRLNFTSSDGSLHFDCLENLCGQRIARAVTDSPEPPLWSVTGELTEFRGTNYLLLSQAILKPRPRRSTHAP